jgi:hypothetical protein
MGTGVWASRVGMGVFSQSFLAGETLIVKQFRATMGTFSRCFRCTMQFYPAVRFWVFVNIGNVMGRAERCGFCPCFPSFSWLFFSASPEGISHGASSFAFGKGVVDRSGRALGVSFPFLFYFHFSHDSFCSSC